MISSSSSGDAFGAFFPLTATILLLSEAEDSEEQEEVEVDVEESVELTESGRWVVVAWTTVAFRWLALDLEFSSGVRLEDLSVILEDHLEKLLLRSPSLYWCCGDTPFFGNTEVGTATTSPLVLILGVLNESAEVIALGSWDSSTTTTVVAAVTEFTFNKLLLTSSADVIIVAFVSDELHWRDSAVVCEWVLPPTLFSFWIWGLSSASVSAIRLSYILSSVGTKSLDDPNELNTKRK